MKKVNVISFGNKSYYYNLALDLHKKIKEKYSAFSYISYNENDLDDEINLYAKKYPKGYGYWIWKPIIAIKTFEKMEYGDILIYLDGRCYFMGYKISWLEDFINTHDDIGVWKLGDNQLEFQWTSADLFDFFDADETTKLSSQFAATIFLMRKSNETISLLNDWYQIMLDRGDLVRYDEPIRLSVDGFIDNKHDQSVFSLLVKSKKYNRLSKMIIEYETMLDSDQSLLIDFRMRQGFMSRQIDFIRIHFPIIGSLLKPVYFFFNKKQQ